MQSDLESFKAGWYGLTLGIKSDEIDGLINALKHLKKEKGHFHFRGNYEGEGGVGDIEFYYQSENGPVNLELDASPAIYPSEKKT